jgi:hypothetical protein
MIVALRRWVETGLVEREERCQEREFLTVNEESKGGKKPGSHTHTNAARRRKAPAVGRSHARPCSVMKPKKK